MGILIKSFLCFCRVRSKCWLAHFFAGLDSTANVPYFAWKKLARHSGRLLDAVGHHRVVCVWVGVLGGREFALEKCRCSHLTAECPPTHSCVTSTSLFRTLNNRTGSSSWRWTVAAAECDGVLWWLPAKNGTHVSGGQRTEKQIGGVCHAEFHASLGQGKGEARAEPHA